MKRLLEICCDHLGSALAAQSGGADRIELCAALSTDGLSPSAGLLASVKKQLKIPVFVLIRPRPGDFVYNEMELEEMLFDIHQSKALGADGIVSGALLKDQQIDLEATAKLVAAARPLPFTFHKAFDLIPNAVEGLEQLMNLEVDRILTSGQAKSALEGKRSLQQLANMGVDKIEILCAGGIRDHNLEELLSGTQLKEFHSAALSKTSGIEKDITISHWQVNEQMVKKMAAVIKSNSIL